MGIEIIILWAVIALNLCISWVGGKRAVAFFKAEKEFSLVREEYLEVVEALQKGYEDRIKSLKKTNDNNKEG